MRRLRDEHQGLAPAGYQQPPFQGSESMHLMRSASLLALLLLASSGRADLPSPRFDRLTPLGAVAGADIEEATKLLFDHPGITAKHVKDRKFAVSIAADVPAGTYDARLVGKYGVTNPRLFAVSRGLTEVAEKSPNEDRETAQLV